MQILPPNPLGCGYYSGGAQFSQTRLILGLIIIEPRVQRKKSLKDMKDFHMDKIGKIFNVWMIVL